MTAQPDLFGTAPQPVDHRCLGCGQVHQGAREVTLIDGTTASSYSEAWRLECEARSVLGIALLAKRQRHLADIEKKRGKAAADQLRAKILEIWEAARAEKMRA